MEHNIKYNQENPKEFIDAERIPSILSGVLFLVIGVVFRVLAIGTK